MLYGDLSLEDLKKEQGRMEPCLRNGVKNTKWKTTAASAKPRSPGRKPELFKEPKPQSESVAEVVEAISPTSAPVTKANSIRKPAITKVKA